MICNQPFFRVGEDGILLFCAGDDHFKGNQQVFLIDGLSALPDSPESGFIH